MQVIEKAASENPELCVTLLRQNAHLPNVNSAFVSVASLDFGVFGGRQIGITLPYGTRIRSLFSSKIF